MTAAGKKHWYSRTPKRKHNIYTNNGYPRLVDVDQAKIFDPIQITLYTVADPSLPRTFAACNRAYTFCKPFEKLGMKVEVVLLTLERACYCPNCDFSWVYLMYRCPECEGDLEIESLAAQADPVSDLTKFFVRGVPHIELEGHTWIEGARFSLTQLSKQVNHLYLAKDKAAAAVTDARYERWLYADYIEVILPHDHTPEPFNKRIIRKSALTVRQGYLNTDYLDLEEAGVRVTPLDPEIYRKLQIRVVPLPQVGWQLKDQVVMKEQYIDMANIGVSGKTARKASTAYATRTKQGKDQEGNVIQEE